MAKISDCYDEFLKPVDVFMDRLKGISSTSLSPAVIDAIRVGGRPIGSFANTFRQANAIIVQCSDPVAAEVAGVLRSAGFNCYASSKMHAVVTCPKPSGEDRKDMERHINKLAEEARIAVRRIRRNVKKYTEIPEKQVDEVCSMAIKRIDKVAIEKITALS